MTDFWVSEKELTDLKPLLPAALSEIGFTDDGTVVSVAVNCLQVRPRCSVPCARSSLRFKRHLDAESMRKALDPLLDAGAERFLGVLKERIASVKTKKKLEPEPKRPREDLPPLIEPEHKDKKTRTERDSKDTRESRHRDDRERDRDRERRDRDRDRDHRDRRDRDDRDKDRHSHRDRDRDHDDRKRRRDDDAKERSSSDVKKESASSSAASASATDAKPAGGEVKTESGAGDAPKAPATDIKSRIAEALAKARKAKEAAAGGAPAAAPSATEAKAPNPNSSDAAERLAAMQARVAAQMRKIKGTELPSMPHILRVDEQGREVDSEGRVLQPSKKAFTATTLINKKLQRERVMKLLAPPSSITDPRKNPFFDPRLPGAGADSRRIKSRNAFVFKEAGTYVKAAQKLRAEAAKEQQIKEAATEGEKVPEEAAAAKPARAKEPIPAIEWWDVPVMREESAPLQTKVAIPGDLGARSYETFIAEERITHYVEHPVPIEPAHEMPPPPPRPLLMTKEERKKFRKKNRMEMQKEKRERQLLGLEPPPEPKVKISNLYRVLGTQAVADPSALEKMVREQMAARLQAHDQRNQERKLTPEERAEKKKKKLQEDTSKQVCACLFKVRRLVTLPRAKFKVDINAQQLYLTGCVLSCGETTLVLVEGGPKNMKKYKTLLGRRIDWSEEPSAEKAEGDGKKEGEQKAPAPAAPSAAAKEPNLCELVWEGTLGRTTFRNFRFETFENETAARKFLQDRGVGHLWDLGRAHVLGETPAILLD